ncbi:MAG TPA: hypothetical protein QF753_00610 [Victivallales bacterium]|nr:hypothetical protein [Victivallales bacterium]
MNRESYVSEKYPFIVLCITILIGILFLSGYFSFLTSTLSESLLLAGLIILIYYTYKTKRLTSMWYFIVLLVFFNPFTKWNHPIVDDNTFVEGVWFCVEILVLIIFAIYAYIYFPRRK